MLDLMRRKKRLKIILWLVIFSLALGMLLFFVPGVNVGYEDADTSAATVDGQPVTMKDFSSAYRRVVKRYSASGNSSLDPETLKAMGLPRQVLDDLITTRIIQILAKRFGVEVTPDEIRNAVETLPYLQEEGKFIGIERYKALLSQNDYSVTDFENDIYKLQLTKKLREIITDALDVSDRELRDEFSKTNQRTQVSYVILKKDNYKKLVNPTEAELRAYFDTNKETYHVKEKRRAQYLLIPVAGILSNTEATEQEVLDEWEKRPHDEAVDIAHIFFPIMDPPKEAEAKAEAEAVLKRAKAGENFASLVGKYSKVAGDTGPDGYLGSFQRGELAREFSREFEDAAFSLKPGEISELVRSQFGYHILRVLKHETPTLESNRPRLIAEIRLRKAQDLARQKAEEAAGLAEKQKDLSALAKDLGIAAEVKETGLFEKDNPIDRGISQAMRDEIFELKQIGSFGKAVEHSSGYAVPKLLEVQLPKPGDFAESRSQVEKDYIEAKSKELMQAEAKKLSEEGSKQGDLAKAARGMSLSVKTSQEFTISGTPDPEIGSNPEFNKTAFELAPGTVSTPQSLLDNMVVFQVKSRSPFDESAYQKEKPELRKRMLQSNQDLYFQDYIRNITEDLEKAGKIRINPKAIERASLGYS